MTRDFVRLFKLRSFSDQLLFPEMMGKCIIVNTPSLFGYVWSMFSPMVDARTRAKVKGGGRGARGKSASQAWSLDLTCSSTGRVSGVGCPCCGSWLRRNGCIVCVLSFDGYNGVRTQHTSCGLVEETPYALP